MANSRSRSAQSADGHAEGLLASAGVAAMSCPTLTIDLDLIVSNWRALDARSACGVETAAVVKADGYGTGAEHIVPALRRAGVRTFFVAVAAEGAAVRRAAGPDAEIHVFGGHMDGDAAEIADHALIPLLNSARQVRRHRGALPGHPFGIQIDSGMNRLGMSCEDFTALRDIVDEEDIRLVVSHLACTDDAGNPLNSQQLATFHAITAGLRVRRSLAATGGILLGRDYHFDVTRPGIGLFGGDPFTDGTPVVTLDAPVIQTREIPTGGIVGYGAEWVARRPSRIATLAIGYADGLSRALGGRGASEVWAGDTRCPIVGRISMDLTTVDVTHVETLPDSLQILNRSQTIDDLAAVAGTIGYEILTGLGGRIRLRYFGG